MATERDRTALGGLETRLFQLVSKNATSAQWAEWLRAPLEHAVAEGDKDLALTLLKAGANGGPGWKGCDDCTLLQAAAEGGNEEVVRALLDIEGMEEVDAVSGDEGRTALHRAAAGGHTDAARVLVVAGANVGLVDGSGSTALHYAIEGGHLQLAEDLVIAGANLEANDGDSNTPLHLAAAHNDVKFIRTLTYRGVRVSVRNKAGQHPLHIAVEHEHVAVTEALLKAGADLNVRFGDLNEFSPLYLARRNAEMTKLLLGFGADVKSVDSFGLTALHWAGRQGIPEVVHALIEGGADLEERSLVVLFSEVPHLFRGFTPLHVAAYWEKLGTLLTLLQKGANANTPDDDGCGPLHLVCKFPNPSSAAVADLLLRWGADETATDNDGNTPADLVKSGAEPNEGLQRLLANAPADRAWRRRGMVVMLRAQGVEAANAAPADRACRRRGTLAMVRTQGEDAAIETTTDSVLPRLVGLEDEALFQAIVRFL
ncbi:unnamed protein product [Ectocarpus sp. 8 AP-2014]